MARIFSLPTICLLLLTLTLGLANAARHLSETSTLFTPAGELPSLPPVEESTTTTTPAPVAAAPADETPTADDSTTTTTAASAAAAPAEDTPAADDSSEATAAAPAASADDSPAADDSSEASAPAAAADDSSEGAAPAAASAGGAEDKTEHQGHPTISFFMHDVLGGSSASGRIVTGLIATSDVNGIPFSRPNNQVFPVANGVPLTNNANLLNNNNVPFVAGLTGQNQPQSQTTIQNTGTNNVVNGGNNNQAFVTPGQLPSSATLQKLLFGSITVIDDELTESHELGAGVIGRGQGFYLASSLDGESHTMAFTAVFHPEDHNHEEEDTISFFGVHRTASPISQMAIVGGTGKYENAKGYTTIETLPQQDQHTTDGVDTVAKFTVYLTAEKH
ncbi:Dirigent protein 9 [Bienertia sinuspersici]